MSLRSALNNPASRRIVELQNASGTLSPFGIALHVGNAGDSLAFVDRGGDQFRCTVTPADGGPVHTLDFDYIEDHGIALAYSMLPHPSGSERRYRITLSYLELGRRHYVAATFHLAEAGLGVGTPASHDGSFHVPD